MRKSVRVEIYKALYDASPTVNIEILRIIKKDYEEHGINFKDYMKYLLNKGIV